MGKGVSDAAVQAAEEAERPEIHSLRLSNGIVLKVKAVPPFLIRQAAMNVAKPVPPKIRLEDKGVEEENPDDPAYQEALKEHFTQSAEAGSDLMMMAGTEVESLSDGHVPPESDDWLELVQLVGVKVDIGNRYSRYLAWLKFYAIETEKDLFTLISALGQKIGLSEEEVSKTVDSFRGGEMGGADNRLSPEDPGDGDSVPLNRAGRRARSRGEGSS